MRSCQDVDETALSYAEIKALCAGNPLIKEKMELDNEVAKLRMLQAEHKSQHYRLEDSLLTHFPQQIKSVTERIEYITKDIAKYAELKEKSVDIQMLDGATCVGAKFPSMVIKGVTHTEKEPAAKALLDACSGIIDNGDKQIGEYMGFKLSISFDSFSKQIKLQMRGNLTYQIDLGTDAFGNITRINNALEELPKRLEGIQSQLDNLYSQQEAAKVELALPFEQEPVLAEMEARLALLNADLNIDSDGSSGLDVINDTETRNGTDELPRTGTYGKAEAASKTAPTFMDNIRSLGDRKRDGVQGDSKSSEITI